MRKCLAIAGMFIVGWAASPTSLAAQTLDKIKQRGVLVVGTKADYKPFGFRDPTGAIVGFEPDLAKDVADKLGVKLQIEPVVSSNRMQFLQQGKIDLMIATMNETDERRKTVGIVEPSYYASGVNVFANSKAGLKSWEAAQGPEGLRHSGRLVQQIRRREIRRRDRRLHAAQTEAETALLQGNCIAWLYDDTAFAGALADPKWAGFEMPLPTILEEPWGVAVKLEERDGPWGKFMAATIDDWHRSGADRAREEVEDSAVGVPEKSQAEASERRVPPRMTTQRSAAADP